MPVELRKRKEAPPAPVRPTKKKAPAKDKKPESEKTVVEKVQETVTEQVEAVKEAVVGKSNGKSAAAATGPPKAGDTIDLASFGGEIETNDGDKTTLAKLVEESKGGVVLSPTPRLRHQDAQNKPVSSATRTIPSPQLATPSTASQPIAPKPTQPSRPSRSFPTPCFATPRRVSSQLSDSRSHRRAQRAVSLLLTRKARCLHFSLVARRLLSML